MYKMSRTKRYVLTAMCITLCAVLPLVLHAVPGAGSILLPMHIPVLLCGLIVGWPFGLMAGIFGPLLSSFTTGMPLIAFAPIMMIELGVYGMVAGLIIRIVRTNGRVNKHISAILSIILGRVVPGIGFVIDRYVHIYIALIPAMFLGRIIGGAARAFLFVPEAHATHFAWFISSYFITSAPGIIIQLVLIPVIIIALEKAKLVRK